MQNDIDIDFFQILDRKQIKMKRQKEILKPIKNTNPFFVKMGRI